MKHSVCIPSWPALCEHNSLLPVHLITCKHFWRKLLDSHSSLEKRRQVSNYLHHLIGKLSKVAVYHSGHASGSGTRLHPRSVSECCTTLLSETLVPTCLLLRCALKMTHAFKHMHLYMAPGFSISSGCGFCFSFTSLSRIQVQRCLGVIPYFWLFKSHLCWV